MLPYHIPATVDTNITRYCRGHSSLRKEARHAGISQVSSSPIYPEGSSFQSIRTASPPFFHPDFFPLPFIPIPRPLFHLDASPLSPLHPNPSPSFSPGHHFPLPSLNSGPPPAPLHAPGPPTPFNPDPPLVETLLPHAISLGPPPPSPFRPDLPPRTGSGYTGN